MRLRFLFGRGGIEKERFIVDEIKQKMSKDPFGAPIYYIVPEQMTFQQEYELFKNGSTRAHVVSFSRLSWHVLQKTGGGTRKFISSVGIQMMLRKIIEERATSWQTFHTSVEKQGFLDQLERLITEFKRHNISPDMIEAYIEELQQFVHKTEEEEALSAKLTDLLYIYEQLTDALKDTYIDSEDQLELLRKKVEETNFFHGALIYLDGFHRFTPKELRLVETLMRQANRVTVSLTGERPKETVSELDLFYQTSKTFYELSNIAKKHDLEIESDVVIEDTYHRLKDRPYFSHLEKYFDVQPAPKYNDQAPITIAEAVHPRAEIEGVAQEIIRLVREENYRYRDLAIFLREPDKYHEIIETIFNDYQIPVFIDEKKSMLNHALIELIRSALEVIETHWRSDAIFRVLKTGFIPSTDETEPLTKDAIDELENYVLEYGIRSRSQWTADEEWIFQRFRGFDDSPQTDWEKQMQQRINAYRWQVVRFLQPFDERIRQAKTIQAFCEAIYLFLEELEVPKRLESWQNFYDEQGEVEKAREQEQVWNATIQLLDEMVEIAGDEKITLATLRSSLDAGFESLKFSHVPPTIDHVIVGTIDHSRISGIKGAFLIGVNDGVWPLRPKAEGLINEQERALLASKGLNLADSSERQLLDDWFYMYLAFTVAKDYLWVSYVLSDEEGQAKMPSQLIKRLQDLFPQQATPILLQDPDEKIDPNRFITTPVKTRAALTAQLARFERGYPIDPIWIHVLNWYIEKEPKFSTTYLTLQSLFYKNIPRNLSETTVEKVYPQQIETSVSQLEMYYRCAFQHFAQYTLGLEERRTYKLDAPDIGQLFHEALSKITQWLEDEGKSLADVSKEEAKMYAKEAISELAPILQHQILHSSNRYQYIQRKLQEVIARATYVLSEQARTSQFTPVGVELSFGMKDSKSLAPLNITLPNGYELILRGRIDRVDQAKIDDELFLRIIDYKSSAHGLNLLEVYYGLTLQMLAYLDVVLTQSETWLGLKANPAGVLYFHVHDAMISEQQRIKQSQLEAELFKRYRMQGLLLEDEQVIQQMDTTLESGRSQVIPAGIRKSGGFYKDSKVIKLDLFAALQAHIRSLMEQAGLQMTSGILRLNPFEYQQHTACRFCPFSAVCQFDPLLEENKYRSLRPMKDEEILEIIYRGE